MFLESLRGINQLKTIAMTTNGLTLTKLLVDLQQAGLNSINISLDTLQQNTYGKITRRDGRLLKRVLAGIDLALQLGFRPVKVIGIYIYLYIIMYLTKYFRTFFQTAKIFPHRCHKNKLKNALQKNSP